MTSGPPLSYTHCLTRSILSSCLCLPGCHRQDHEDEEGVEAPTAAGRGPQPAVLQIQTQGSSY